KILHGMPTGDLNVIVPFTMLAGAMAPTCACHGPAKQDGPGHGPPKQDGPGHGPPKHHVPGHMPPDHPWADHSLQGQSLSHSSQDDEAHDQSPPGSAARVGIAEVVGRHSAFVSTRDVRELLFTPGSMLHRLVTDPTTGRCVERSTTAYRFTAAQRAQI